MVAHTGVPASATDAIESFYGARAADGPLDKARAWQLIIGDRRRAAEDDRTYSVECPFTGEPLGEVPDASAGDVEAAVSAGLTAWPAWAALAPRARAQRLRAVAAVLRTNEDELALLDALDTGHPITAMLGDVRLAADMLDCYADWSLELRGETLPIGPEHLNLTVREPFGVVARIVAYNHPVMFLASRLGAPLLAGNTIVLKAPDQCPLSGLRLAELLVGVLPPGVVTVLSGRGPIAGDALVRHPDIRRIAFIGSVTVGRKIQESAAQAGVKQVTLELGGKNALIAFADADPAEVAHGAVNGMNFRWTAGQSCGSTSRLLVHDSLYDEVVRRVGELVNDIRIGDPLDPATEMGCLVSAAHRSAVADRVTEAVRDGARMVTRALPESPDFAHGHWYPPTVLADVTPAMSVAREEIFGPVLSVLRFADEEAAVALTNDVRYGLTASIYTQDVRRAHRVSRAVQVGYVWVNTSSRHFLGVPFGGVKDSGVGREEGVDELHSFTQLKTINIALT